VTYRLSILRKAQKELAQVSPPAYDRIVSAIRGLAEEPRPPGSRKLSGREGWRIRVGDFRVLYSLDDSERTVTVMHVGHRRDVYR
jgi:mRNA interferase RelE/StbE